MGPRIDRLQPVRLWGEITNNSPPSAEATSPTVLPANCKFVSSTPRRKSTIDNRGSVRLSTNATELSAITATSSGRVTTGIVPRSTSDFRHHESPTSHRADFTTSTLFPSGVARRNNRLMSRTPASHHRSCLTINRHHRVVFPRPPS